MPLKHGFIEDTDPHFIIDTVTRKLTTTSQKITLVQGDHNSECFTFEVPQRVEGHEMGHSDKVEIHFLNIDQMTKKQSSGVYQASDLTFVDADDEHPARVTFSWVIDHTATKYQGALNFVVRFICSEGDAMVYSWSTTIHTGISITDGINNSQMIVDEYIDVLKAWERELKANQVVSLEQTVTGDPDGGENVWTATFGDGRTSELKVKNGQRGPTGYIGSIETVNHQPLHFFVGTQAEYEALPEAQKENLFAITTDDLSADDILERFRVLEQWKLDTASYVESLQNGSVSVKYAKEAEYADRCEVADMAGCADVALAVRKQKTQKVTLGAAGSITDVSLGKKGFYSVLLTDEQNKQVYGRSPLLPLGFFEEGYGGNWPIDPFIHAMEYWVNATTKSPLITIYGYLENEIKIQRMQTNNTELDNATLCVTFELYAAIDE